MLWNLMGEKSNTHTHTLLHHLYRNEIEMKTNKSHFYVKIKLIYFILEKKNATKNTKINCTYVYVWDEQYSVISWILSGIYFLFSFVHSHSRKKKWYCTINKCQSRHNRRQWSWLRKKIDGFYRNRVCLHSIENWFIPVEKLHESPSKSYRTDAEKKNIFITMFIFIIPVRIYYIYEFIENGGKSFLCFRHNEQWPTQLNTQLVTAQIKWSKFVLNCVFENNILCSRKIKEMRHVTTILFVQRIPYCRCEKKLYCSE